MTDDRLSAGRACPDAPPLPPRMSVAMLLTGVAMTLSGARDARAQTTTAAAAPCPTAPGTETVIVNGTRFLDADTSGITNLPLAIEKVPGSISILDNDFAEAADVTTLADVARYAPGATWSSFIPSYGTELLLRGLPATYAIDGLTVGDQIDEPDPATLERYEVVKGPASVVYGAENPGGVVNLVSKSAGPGTPNYLQVLGGSWGRWRLEGQAEGALDASGTVRGILVVVREEGGGFTDFVDRNKIVLYGGIEVDLAPELTGTIRVSYQRTENTSFNGLPTFPNGVLPPVRYDYFVGGADLATLAQATRVNAALSWRPAGAWSFKLQAIGQYNTHGGENAYAAGFVENGAFPVSGEQFNRWAVQDYTVAASALRTLDDVGLSGSSLSASVRYQHFDYAIRESFLNGLAEIGAGDGTIGDGAISDYFDQDLTPGGRYQENEDENFLTASTQAVVKIARPLTLIGGLSFSRPWIAYQTYDGPEQDLSPEGQVDGRAAAVLTPLRGLNVYFSYSQSYQPNLRLDIDDQVLQPLTGTQYEVGAKYLTAGKKLLLTAAPFSITEDNLAEYDTTVDNEALYKAEQVRHRGLELEATGQITPRWQVKAGFSLLDPVVLDDPANPADDGETRPWLPKVTADAFTRYTFGDGLFVAGGLRFVGSEKTYDNASAPTPNLPAYTLIDAAIGWSVGRWQLQANLKNIFDQHYYIAPFDTFLYGLYPGEPRSVSVSVRRDF